jgi:hypothetical protein
MEKGGFELSRPFTLTFGKLSQISERDCTVLSADTIRRIYESGEALIVESRRRRQYRRAAGVAAKGGFLRRTADDA